MVQFLCTKFLERQSKNHYTIDFQDVDQTNTLLSKQNITLDNISKSNKEELCKILNVDVVFSGKIHRSKPMSEGSAMVLGGLFGAWGATNPVEINANIHAGQNNLLLWNYSEEYSGSVGLCQEQLTKAKMNGISRKFPYNAKK